jgi:hypothetical protein
VVKFLPSMCKALGLRETERQKHILLCISSQSSITNLQDLQVTPVFLGHPSLKVSLPGVPMFASSIRNGLGHNTGL